MTDALGSMLTLVPANCGCLYLPSLGVKPTGVFATKEESDLTHEGHRFEAGHWLLYSAYSLPTLRLHSTAAAPRYKIMLSILPLSSSRPFTLLMLLL
jgi:hypothetical protein